MQVKNRGREGDGTEAGCCGGIANLMPLRLFRALCDPNRVALLARLAECRRACTVSEIAECCPVDLSVVSRHLATLRDAGVVESVKQGKEVYYSLCASSIADTLRAIANALDACCPTLPQRVAPRGSGTTRKGNVR